MIKKFDLVFATHNENKVAEVREILKDFAEVRSLNDIRITSKIPETSDSYEGNAFQKVEYLKRFHSEDCFAEDSGLEVEALNGAPGIYSARYLTEFDDYNSVSEKLLHKMKYKANRQAQFVAAISLLINDEEYFFRGVIKGTITTELRGTNGFAYDNVFMPYGYDKTFAEMSDELKNRISHRAIAINKMKLCLEDLMNWMSMC